MVSRYIHLNPVEAGIVAKAEDYKWSSYKAYLGAEKNPGCLVTENIIEQIKSCVSLAHISDYKTYVETTDISEINTFYSQKHTSPILGSENFIKRMVSTVTEEHKVASSSDVRRALVIPSIEQVHTAVKEYYDLTTLELLTSKRGRTNWPKQVALYICKERYGYSLAKIAESMPEIGKVTVGTAVHKCKQMINGDPALLERIQHIIEVIENKFAQGCT